mgnify:CR=1 FL=1
MNRLFYIGVAIAAVVVLVAIFAPFVATHDVTAQNLGGRFASPSAEHWFGTDALGRDIFSRLIYGARISLQVGITVVVVSGVIGIVIGAIAGFYGGWVDRFLSGYLFNVFLAFPGLLLAIALVAFLGAGLGKLILALCVIGWVGYARVMRGQVLKVREYDFVMAAKALGAPTGMDWHDCQVVSEDSGKPRLEVSATVAAAAASMGVTDWRISISHDAGIAAAVVIALG